MGELAFSNVMLFTLFCDLGAKFNEKAIYTRHP